MRIGNKLLKVNSFFKKYGFGEGIVRILSKLFFAVISPISNKLISLIFSVKENRIIFESKSDFSDNGRALFEYLIEKGYNEKYQIVWLVANPRLYEKYKEKNVLFVKSIGSTHGYYTIRAFYYARTSKIFFFTHTASWIKEKTENQILVNLWHGSGYKAAKGGSEKIFFDYCLVPGKVFIETKKEFFNCGGDKILPLGYPRYKWFKSSSSSISRLMSNINGDFYRTIIWMPTFRKTSSGALSENTLNSDFDLPIISTYKDFEDLNRYCKQYSIKLLIKPHRLQMGNNTEKLSYSNILFLTDDKLNELGIRLYELISDVDGLITDYSSVAIDFLLLNKQIAFTLDDYEKYRNSRGFVFENPLDYMPGEHLYKLEDMYSFIKNVADQKDEYKIERSRVRAITHNETDDYCFRILQYVNIKLDN